MESIAKAVSEGLGREVELPDLSFDPIGETFRVEIDEESLFAKVVYVAMDPWPPQNFWGDDAVRGGLRRFRLASTRASYLRRLQDENGFGFDVEACDDGYRARLLGSIAAPLGVYALPQDVAEAVRAGEMDLDSAMAAANVVLEDYWAWSRGEACGVVTDVFRVTEEGLMSYDHDADWAVVSERRAQEMLERMDVPAASAGIRP